MAGPAFGIPGFEIIFAQVEQPTVLSSLEPLLGEPIETFSLWHDVFGRLGKIECMREPATGDEKCSAIELPHRLGDDLAKAAMRFAWPAPPD